MGVATSAATFFRQIGGTMGTAVLLSMLFTAMPTNIMKATGNETDLRQALDAAFDSAVAAAPANAGVMEEIWNPIVLPIQDRIASKLSEASAQAKEAATTAVTEQVTAGVQAQVAAGVIPQEAAAGIIQQEIETKPQLLTSKHWLQPLSRRTPPSVMGSLLSTGTMQKKESTG